MSDILLDIRDLSIIYATDDGVTEAPNGACLQLRKGETLGLVGETGAGKTTLARGIMRLIPNPGDGIVQAISDTIHKSVGFTKNCFDLFNIALAVTISFLFAGHPEGIGIGTVLAVIGVGRVISFFNHFAYEKMRVLAGME